MDPDGLDQDALTLEELLERVCAIDEDPLTDLEDSSEETPTKPIDGTRSGVDGREKKLVDLSIPFDLAYQITPRKKKSPPDVILRGFRRQDVRAISNAREKRGT
jgi:hypothetical protein